MKKYCRYCAFCFCGDVYYCNAKDKVLNNISRSVSCEDFALSELGDVDTGKQYKPRPQKAKTVEIDNTSLFENGG